MLFVVVRNAGRLVEGRERCGAVVVLGALDAELDLAHGVEVFLDSRAVAQAQALLDPIDAVGDRIENTAIGSHLHEP